MPEWIHNRAEHILAKNPSMSKSQAFAIATQQAHAVGKSPKGYGTSEGRREAKMKYDTPKDDTRTANPGGLESPKMAGASLGMLKEVAQSRGFPTHVGALAQAANPRFDVGRRREIMRSVIDHLRGMPKKASGFTTTYDGEGNLTGRETRMQELARIFGSDGSFGFGKTSSVALSSFADELIRIMREN